MRCWPVAVLALLAARTAAAEEEPIEPEGPEGETPPVEMTLLRVASIPPRAEVVVDDHPCGLTPALIEVLPGRHEVVVTLGARRVRSVVIAVEEETVEIEVDVGMPQEPPADEGGPEPTPAVRQEADDERLVEDETPREPWHRRVPAWPWAELQIYPGVVARDFAIDINPELDPEPDARSQAQLETGPVALLGFRVSIFPAVRARTPALRGIGIEGGYGRAFGLRVRNSRLGIDVSSSYYEADAGLIYRLLFGTIDRGAQLVIRVGWHRTEFYLGETGNDLIPPFTYDTVRLGAGIQVPLFTRHVVAELFAAYLAVAGVQGAREYGVLEAYSEDGGFTSHGGEVSAGLVGRAGPLDVGVHWHGRWFSTEFEGPGNGWGLDPTTRRDFHEDGIETESPGSDSYQQFRFSVAYRF
jgi:hypothetical protein